MWTQVERGTPMPLWGAEIALCFLAALGLAGIARSIPDSYASMPDRGARVGFQAAPVEAVGAKPLPASTSLPTDARKRQRCPECGTIESMRRTERTGEDARHRSAALKAAAAGPRSAGVGHAPTEPGYEITVRLRDGTTTVFNEATPRDWRAGGRVMVIAGLQLAGR